MDYEMERALRAFRQAPSAGSARDLLAHMDRAGLMPDSPRQEIPPISCNLDDLGNATAHVEIGNTRLLLFHKHVVAVQTVGMPAVINPDPICSSVTTKKRIREWPFARHSAEAWGPSGALPYPETMVRQENWNNLLRFKPA